MATTTETTPSKNGKSKAKAPPNLGASPPTDGETTTTKPWKKQTEIPGTERAVIADLDVLAAKYVALRDKRAKMQADEKVMKAELTELLKKHELESYAYVDGGVEYVVELDVTEKLTVSKSDGDDD
jgi:hypothetical protein